MLFQIPQLPRDPGQDTTKNGMCLTYDEFGKLRSLNYEVSATPCTESETAHAPSSGVAETLLHEPAGSESSYGDLVMIVAAQDRARSSRVAGGHANRTIGWE
jgi:hypothetical protein